MKPDYPDIARRRLKQLGLGAVEAATSANVERGFVRDLVEGKKKSVRSDKLVDLARALRLDLAALSRGELVGLEEVTPDIHPARVIPILSTVSAGALLNPHVADDAIGSIAVPDLGPGDFIALKIEGNSMNQVAPHDSLVVVNRSDTELVPGRLYVIADEDGSATFKKYRTNPERYEPLSFDASYETLYPDNTPKVIGHAIMAITML